MNKAYRILVERFKGKRTLGKCNLVCVNIVTYRPTAKQQVCKEVTIQQPLLGNSSVHKLFPRQRENTQEWKRRSL
jgi:hypothetical protein